MGNLLAYSGIVTKVRAMQAKLLTDEDFQNIAAFHTVTEVAAISKNIPDIGMSLQIWTKTVFTAVRLRSFLCSHFTVIIHACTVFPEWYQKKFLELYLKRYEMNLINYCLRIVFNHYQKPFDLDHKKIFFDKYSDLSIDKLITSGKYR